jgi:hypothetical protein
MRMAAKADALDWKMDLPTLSHQIEERLAHFDLSKLSAPLEVSADLT